MCKNEKKGLLKGRGKPYLYISGSLSGVFCVCTYPKQSSLKFVHEEKYAFFLSNKIVQKSGRWEFKNNMMRCAGDAEGEPT